MEEDSDIIINRLNNVVDEIEKLDKELTCMEEKHLENYNSEDFNIQHQEILEEIIEEGYKKVLKLTNLYHNLEAEFLQKEERIDNSNG